MPTIPVQGGTQFGTLLMPTCIDGIFILSWQCTSIIACREGTMPSADGLGESRLLEGKWQAIAETSPSRCRRRWALFRKVAQCNHRASARRYHGVNIPAPDWRRPKQAGRNCTSPATNIRIIISSERSCHMSMLSYECITDREVPA